ncbi:PLP-dependent aminotransferase family protein [Rugosimonospora acidiphila]|uniref:PLP-dependent aminotransferase family protein n=1 Tax=Rugosimonospora acidiphila TaxID=556531 RepID=A0ABP9RRV2_9ACTN
MSEDWATFGIDLHLDLDAATGRRSGLERALRDAVRDGRLAAGARLPSTRALAAELGLSRGTVSAAYDQLVAEGYLTARRGSGTEVAALTGQAGAPTAPRGAVAPARHNLRPGSPDPTTFPVTAWLRASRRALLAAPAEAYGYGDPRGQQALRTVLADYLGRTRGVLTTPDQLVVTSGYVQALGLLTQVLHHAGTEAVAMEDPGLAVHREVVRRAGPAVLPLPVDRHGARTELLSTRDLEAASAAVVTPAHQYPMGDSLHPDRRRALIQWARSRDGLIIEDDYDGEFRYDRQPVGALQGTAPDHVAYIGTASKTLGPAVRLAWLCLPARLVDPVVDAKLHADHHTESLGQLAFADLIASHAYDRHLRACRLRYRRRRDLLLARLAEGRSAGYAITGIAAGLHALIGLPAGGPTEPEVLARAAAYGVAVDGLANEFHSPGDHRPGIIVGYGTPPEHAYPAALDALARVLG